MRIHLTSVFVDDQKKALRFCTDVLGFRKKYDIPMGEAGDVTTAVLDDTCGSLIQIMAGDF
ncbi:VOC family protein [Streptomyces sp. NPDC052496]|uniref:VOC family protein n=1 Tax=Streptomyces sp. NPDC052496 TaxID=3154951 RepID=UPI00341EE3A0